MSASLCDGTGQGCAGVVPCDDPSLMTEGMRYRCGECESTTLRCQGCGKQRADWTMDAFIEPCYPCDECGDEYYPDAELATDHTRRAQPPSRPERIVAVVRLDGAKCVVRPLSADRPRGNEGVDERPSIRRLGARTALFRCKDHLSVKINIYKRRTEHIVAGIKIPSSANVKVLGAASAVGIPVQMNEDALDGLMDQWGDPSSSPSPPPASDNNKGSD